MRTKLVFSLGAAVLVATLQLPSASSLAASASSSASATVVAPLSITTASGLSFGSLYAGATAGSVVLAADGSRSASGGAGLAAGGGTVASFEVQGAPGASYAVTLPDSALLQDGAGNSMTVTAFSSNAGGVGQLSPEGAQTLAVGAALEVAPAQPQGAYSGSFVVTVEYN